MRPPYDPAHVERVTFGRNENGSDSEVVVARCSCSWRGTDQSLHFAGAARGLAADFNAHRVTYISGEAA